MVSFFNTIIQFLNNFQELLGPLGGFFLAPFYALASLLKWIFAVFEFIPIFVEYADWAIDILPYPLDAIAYFLLTFISCTLFVGVIKLIVR